MTDMSFLILGLGVFMGWHDFQSKRESGNTNLLFFLRESAELLGHTAGLLLVVFVLSQFDLHDHKRGAWIYVILFAASFILKRLRKKEDVFWVCVLSISFLFAARMTRGVDATLVFDFIRVVSSIMVVRFLLVGLHLRMSFASPSLSLRGFSFYLLIASLVAVVLSGFGALVL